MIDNRPSKIWVAPETGCWIWQGTLNSHGYGSIKFRQVQSYAHRLTYELFIGPIPKGLELHHLCHAADQSCLGGSRCPHRRCVNPMHMQMISRSDHTVPTLHSAPSVNKRKTHCPRGHEYTEENIIRVGKNRRGRMCRACHNAWNKEYVKRKGPKVFPPKRCVICGDEFIPKQGRKILCRTHRCKRLHAQYKREGRPLPFG